MQMILKATGCPIEAVRGFLDGRYGRELVGEIAPALHRGGDLRFAIGDAVALWMEKLIDSRVEEELGIPAGLPRLIGFVRMHQAMLDLAAA